jgi:RNA polymerase sigma factor (sigma-70 family)
MAHAPLGTVLRHIRRLTAEPAPELADRDLLQRFIHGRDQAAFTALVERHGPLVLGVCRHVLGHLQDAEDAFQATFLVLARNAAAIRTGDALPCWLHGVAYRISMRAKRDAARRRNHEKRVSARAPAWDEAWRGVQAVLDDEVARLPEKYRAPFILCCLEGKSRSEAGSELGVKEGTVWSRLAEARRLLRGRLARRGVTLGAVLGAMALSATGGRASFSAPLVQATVAAALRYAFGEATARIASARAAVLADGVRKTIALARWKLATMVLLTAGVVAAATGFWSRTSALEPPALARGAEAAPLAAVPPKQAPAKPPAEKPKPPLFLQEDGDRVTVNGLVVGPDGQPFAGAKVYLLYHSHKRVRHKPRAVTGADGRFRFTYYKADYIDEPSITWRGEPWRYYHILAAAPGYGPNWIWMPDIKGELKLQLNHDDVAIRGRVIDLQGRAVAGATVQVLGAEWATLLDDVTTASDGRFVIKGIGRDRSVELRVAAPSIELKRVGVTTASKVAGKPTDRVTVEIVAGPTKPITGTVRARDTGKPLAGAVVYAKYADFLSIHDDLQGVQAVTDDQGRYRLVGLPKAEKYEVTVYPPVEQGYLFATKEVGTTEGLKRIALDLDLRRGVPVRFRLVDRETGKPVNGIAQYTPARSNPLWTEACSPYSPNFVLPPRVWFNAVMPDKDMFFRFVAYPGHGMVIATAGYGIGPYLRCRLRPEDAAKGHYPLDKGDPNNGFIEIAHGYAVIDTTRTDRVLSFDIEVTRGVKLQGRLVGPDGKPVTGATAYGSTFDASCTRPDMLRETPVAPDVLKTDAFTAVGLYPKEQRTLSFMHKERKLIGHVIVDGTETQPMTVRLKPWGAVSGRLIDPHGKPMANVRVRLLYYPALPRPGMLDPGMTALTDNDGRFRIEGLLPDLKHELSLTSSREKESLSAGAALQAVSAPSGEVKDLGDVRVTITVGK